MSLSYYKLAVILDKDAGGQNGASNQNVEIRNLDSSLASIFSDADGLLPITQPGANTDSEGNFEFYAVAGKYKAVSGSFELPIYIGLNDDDRTYSSLAEVVADKSISPSYLNKGRVQGIGDFEIVASNPSGYYVASANGFIKPLCNDVRLYGATNGVDSSVQAQNCIDDQNSMLVAKDFVLVANEIEVGDNTHITVIGEVRMPPGSDHWSRIFTNKDRVNGNKDVVILGSGVINGNASNQTKAWQYLGFFINCSGFDVRVKTLKSNFAPDPYTGASPPAHPDAPFDQGVPFGEHSTSVPSFAALLFIGGKNNTVRDFELLNWGREGVYHQHAEGSKIENFRAVNGLESDNIYYAPVDFSSKAGSVSLSIGDNVLVDRSHAAGGTPYYIYESLVSGTIDLSTEDYSDAGRWSIVDRDITNDMGYTAARCSGAKGQMNTISNGYAAFCRASSFSNDSETMGMSNLLSYHNSYQVGINFGHTNRPANSGYASGLIAINSGWLGGLGGNSYGINCVSDSNSISLSDFYISGAGRVGLNISNNGTDINISNGVIENCADDGLLNFSGRVKASNVISRNNGAEDFNISGANPAARLSLHNCEDSSGRVINSDEIYPDKMHTVVNSMTGSLGSQKIAFRSDFSVAASSPLASVEFDDLSTADNMIVTICYAERNSGSGAIANQRAAKASFLVSGTGGSRNISQIDAPYSQNRQFRASWTDPALNIYLQDNVPVDVAANAVQNSVKVEVESQVSSGDFRVYIG